MTNGRNEVEVTGVKHYTGEEYESELGSVYQVTFRYQAAAMLGETTWAGYKVDSNGTWVQ